MTEEQEVEQRRKSDQIKIIQAACRAYFARKEHDKLRQLKGELFTSLLIENNF
jgi:hypothetical protein